MAYFSRTYFTNTGCDISHWQYPVNFTTMYTAGATSCYLKAGQRVTSGSFTKDSELTTTNVSTARAAGLRVGFYWFKNPDLNSYNTTANAESEAEQFYNWIVTYGTGSGTDMGELMPCLDYEDNTGGITTVNNDTAYDWIKAFSDKFKLLSGRQIILYTAFYTIDPLAADGYELIRSTGETMASLMPLWLAATDTGADNTYSLNRFGGYGVYRMWQYSTDTNTLGSTYGVSTTAIDMDTVAPWDRVTRPPAVSNLAGNASGTSVAITFDASLYDDVETTNLMTDNQHRLIAGTTGWSSHNSATISKDATNTLYGNNSLKVVTPGSVAYEGAKTGLIDVAAATQYTASVYIKGTAGNAVRIVMADFTSGGDYLGETVTNISLTANWQRLSVTRTTGATGVKVIVYVQTMGTSAYTFYFSSAQLEAGATATKPFAGKRYGNQITNYTIYEDSTLKATVTATQAADYATVLSSQSYGSHTYSVYANTLFETSLAQTVTVTVADASATDPSGSGLRVSERENSISPKMFSSLVAWYDASQILGKVDGDVVSQLDDLSSNGYHLTQSTNSYRPLYKVGIQNGLPIVRFDGINDYLSVAYGSSKSVPFHLFVVCKADSSTTDRWVFDGSGTSNRLAVSYSVHGTNLIYNSHQSIGGSSLNTTSTSNFSIINSLYNGASGFFSVDSLSKQPYNQGTGSPSGHIVGGHFSLNAAYFGKVDVAEIILYNKTLNDYEVFNIKKYLSKKWGIKTGSPVVLDTMTRANSATLGSCDSNHVWNLGSYDTTSLPGAGIYSNYGYFSATTGTDSHAWIETGVSDCVITCNIRYDADSDKGIIFRRVDANNYFYAHIDSVNDTLKISRCLAGVRSDIASTASATIAPGDQRMWRVILSGSSIVVFSSQNGKSVTATDSNLMTATKHGIYNASGNTTSFRYFSVEV